MSADIQLGMFFSALLKKNYINWNINAALRLEPLRVYSTYNTIHCVACCWDPAVMLLLNYLEEE
jgi:hypothetical protein